VEITWAGGGTGGWEKTSGGAGVYRGTVNRLGVLHGTTYDKNNPSNTASWTSDKGGGMACADVAAVPPSEPTPKILKGTGRKPTNPTPKSLGATGGKPTSTTPQTPSSAAASPTITAQPRVVTIPDGESRGTVTLTWDGGPDHPYAEVWVKEGSQGIETKVVEQGKGTRRVTVERGKNYQFILTDAGQQLAKAVVITKQ